MPAVFYCWLAGATFWWVVAGVLQVSVIPFTLIVILPTNKQLLSPALDRRSAQTGQPLRRWGTLHAGRSVRAQGAVAVGMSDRTYKKAKQVVAEKSPIIGQNPPTGTGTSALLPLG